MAKKTKKINSSLLKLLLCLLGISIILFLFVVYKNNTSSVKGDSTISTGSGSVKMVNLMERTANAGEACGKSVNKACLKDLICAPLGASYKILQAKAAEIESRVESESVPQEQRLCIGKTENGMTGGCMPYIPYYGACIKVGVWPPPVPKITPTPTLSSKPCLQRQPQCVPTASRPCPMYSSPPPGTIFCTPTPTPMPTKSPITFPNCNIRSEPIIKCPTGYTCKNTCNPSPGATGCAQYDICVPISTPTPTVGVVYTPSPNPRIQMRTVPPSPPSLPRGGLRSWIGSFIGRN